MKEKGLPGSKILECITEAVRKHLENCKEDRFERNETEKI
jgi:hypothetical protein